MQSRRYVLGAAAAAVLVLGTAVVASAQNGGNVFGGGQSSSQATTATPTPRGINRDDYLNKLAGNLGIDPAKLRSALQQTTNDAIDEAVRQGRIPADKADQLKQRAAQGDGFFFGPGGPGKRGGGRQGGQGAMKGLEGVGIDQVAKAAGVDAPTLMSELKAGKTLTQIAQEHGKSRDQLRSDLLNAVGPLLDRLLDQPLGQGHGPRAMATATPSS